MEIKNQYLLSFDWLIQSKVEEAPSKAGDETVPPVDVEPDDEIFIFWQTMRRKLSIQATYFV